MATKDSSHLPQPPFFSIPNINNLRDAALHNQPTGLTTPTGKIRPRILFRSADVSKLDRSGWESVRSIGVNHVFDLRSKPEVIKGLAGITGDNASSDGGEVRPGWISDMEAARVNRSWVPVFEDSDYSPERLAERYVKYMDESDTGFVEAYHDILSHAAESYRTIMLYLVNLPPPGQEDGEEPLGALVHCSAGKDRTGIFFGLLFSFLGVPREIIAEEYNLTELGLQGVRGDISSRLLQSPVFKRYALSKMQGVPFTSVSMEEIMSTDSGTVEDVEIPAEIIETGKQAALRMVGARKQSMLLSLEMIDKTWGGPEKYMREVLGLGDNELEALRRNLVVKD